jgi:MFS family permease
MENEIIVDAGASFQHTQLIVSPAASVYLDEARKWGKFLAIMGFCFVGLMLIIGLFAGTIFSYMGPEHQMPFPGFIFGIIYVGMALVYFFPVLYLLRFTNHLKKALLSRSSHELDSAFENLKSHYKYIGIFMIVLIGIYVLIGGAAFLIGDLLS